uniref:Neur_chan_LBD domain-containing protein n=1 Tax=Strongyloides venezuelensis TaxID=75913 RepID=A0A0K0FNK9_STRVS
MKQLYCDFFFLFIFFATCHYIILNCDGKANFPRYADQLYEDLMYMYNKQVRPVKNASKALMVNFGASLIRIIDVVGFY